MARRASSSDGRGEPDRCRYLRAGGSGAQCRPRRIERDVAPADDHDSLTQLDPKALIHVQEVLDRAEHAVEIVARQIEVAGPARSDREEQRGVPIEELRDRVGVTDSCVGLHVHAELDDRFDLSSDQRSGQSVLRDAEHHHAAEAVLRLVDRDRVTGEPKVACRRESGGPAADHADARTAGRGYLAVRGVPHPVRRKALHTEAFGDEPLQRPDRDRRIDTASSTRPFARRGTHAPTHRWERVRGPRDEVGLLETAFGDRSDVGAGVGMDRARGATRLVLPQPLGVGSGGDGH